MRFLGWLLPLVLTSAVGHAQEAGRDPRVTDPVLARLVWLTETGFEGTIGRERLERWTRGGDKASLPLDMMVRVTRREGQGGRPAVVTISFGKPLDVPFPYGILGYKPGRLRSSTELTLSEWNMGDVTFEGVAEGGAAVVLEDLRIFGLARGDAQADFHAWIDKLLGPMVEDTGLEAFFFFRERGAPRGAAVGMTPGGKVHVGLFDLERDTAVFPTPRETKIIGGRLLHWIQRQPAG